MNMKEKMKSLIGFPLDEKAYKVDLELQDRYTAYSSEILRLDLLGIAGYRTGISRLLLHEYPKTMGFRCTIYSEIDCFL